MLVKAVQDDKPIWQHNLGHSRLVHQSETIRKVSLKVQDPAMLQSIQPATMTLANIMKTEVICIDMDATLESALELCSQSGIRHLPVVDEDKRLVGILTDRDIHHHLSPRLGTLSENNSDRATLHRPIHLLMGRKVVKGTPEMSLAAAAARMLHHRVGCLPLVDGEGHVAGIVTESDFLALIAAAAPPEDDPPHF